MTPPRFYILVGDEDTWKTSLQNGVWGFSGNVKGSWNTCNIGDYLAFYVTTPVKKVIGFGKITRKYTNDEIIWSDEKLFGRSMWKYKFDFNKQFAVDSWDTGIPVPSNIMLNTGRKVVSKDTFCELLQRAASKWKTEKLLEFVQCK